MTTSLFTDRISMPGRRNTLSWCVTRSLTVARKIASHIYGSRVFRSGVFEEMLELYRITLSEIYFSIRNLMTFEADQVDQMTA